MDRLTHASFMVKDIEKASPVWTEVFGLKPWSPVLMHFPDLGIGVSIFPVGESGGVELLSATHPDTSMGSIFYNTLQSGRGMHQVTFAVTAPERFQALVKRLQEGERWINMVFTQAGVAQCWVDPISACGAYLEFLNDADRVAVGIPEPYRGPSSGIFRNLSHIGHIVDDLSEAVSLYRDAVGLSLTHERPTSWPEEGVEFLDFAADAGPTMRVLRVTESSSLLGSIHRRHGQGLTYFAFEVEDLDKTIDILNAKQLRYQVRRGGSGVPRHVWVHASSTGGAWLLILPVS